MNFASIRDKKNAEILLRDFIARIQKQDLRSSVYVQVDIYGWTDLLSKNVLRAKSALYSQNNAKKFYRNVYEDRQNNPQNWSPHIRPGSPPGRRSGSKHLQAQGLTNEIRPVIIESLYKIIADMKVAGLAPGDGRKRRTADEIYRIPSKVNSIIAQMNRNFAIIKNKGLEKYGIIYLGKGVPGDEKILLEPSLNLVEVIANFDKTCKMYAAKMVADRINALKIANEPQEVAQ